VPEVSLVDQGATSLDVALDEDDLDEELELELELDRAKD
jgi:hypothetical protein